MGLRSCDSWFKGLQNPASPTLIPSFAALTKQRARTSTLLGGKVGSFGFGPGIDSLVPFSLLRRVVDDDGRLFFYFSYCWSQE
ncbi:hypothetical protein M406DRAFT_103315 [Cryphonectria parasitica EP155]|uniref:Uncharacterized protein n=1 Tax=Cryphonectria parasitica (strain ATCC 38755 / EP155) TaxID=660469 RepID=A0A9P4XX59_CRYP1|nr:uncharacterized protein M406DRAFT_103315 [Cryphonectria parasitica EP155]KAF3762924.1 hypothetical protein M406DRAFT_103315 [Cryphonectria parasitica EP155]